MSTSSPLVQRAKDWDIDLSVTIHLDEVDEFNRKQHQFVHDFCYPVDGTNQDIAEDCEDDINVNFLPTTEELVAQRVA